MVTGNIFGHGGATFLDELLIHQTAAKVCVLALITIRVRADEEEEKSREGDELGKGENVMKNLQTYTKRPGAPLLNCRDL